MRLSGKQKLLAMETLASVRTWKGESGSGAYHISIDAEIGGDGCLRSLWCCGKTMKEAIDNLWDELTSIDEKHFVVAYSRNRLFRRQYRWVGFMWKEV